VRGVLIVKTSAVSLAGVITFVGVGCTTIIGLQDLPDPSSSGGTTATGGVASTAGTSANEPGDAGATGTGGLPAGGEPNGGKSQGGGTTGGSATGGSATGGGGTGGNSSGGTGQGGTAGATQCTPACVTGASCVANACTCPQGQFMCSDACADLATDKGNCGSCGAKCDSACSAGRCYTTLADLPIGEKQIAVNASHVYFTQKDAGKVSRVPRAGGAAEVLAQTQSKPTSIALDQNNVYWINDSYNTPTVQKLPLAGGAAPVQVASTSSLDLYSLAVDASYVYWTQDGLDAAVVKAPLAGGALVPLAPAGANSRSLALDATSVYWASLGDGVGSGTVQKVPKAGGAVVTLASGTDLMAIALYGGFVYFGNRDAIYKVATSGGTVSTLSTEVRASTLAVDASGIYAIYSFGQTSLFQLKLTGQTHATLAKREQIMSLAVDGNSVFWADSTSVNVTTKAP
jgi:hypothetical protein